MYMKLYPLETAYINLEENKGQFQNFVEAKVFVAESWNFEGQNRSLLAFQNFFQI